MTGDVKTDVKKARMLPDHDSEGTRVRSSQTEENHVVGSE